MAHTTQPTLLDRILTEPQDKIKCRMARCDLLPGTPQAFDLMLSDLLINIKEMRAIGDILRDKGKPPDDGSDVMLEQLEQVLGAYLKGRMPHGFVSHKADKRPAL